MARFKVLVTAEVTLDADTPNGAMTGVTDHLGDRFDIKGNSISRFVQGKGWVSV